MSSVSDPAQLPWHRRPMAVPRWPLLLGLVAVACTAPIRQYDIKNQKLTCEQANDATYHTLRTMGFRVVAFEPAANGREGTLRATRGDNGVQNVTVTVKCDDHSADVDASEDGKFLNLAEFKRGFFLAFDAVSEARVKEAAAAKEEAARPLDQKRKKELEVLLEPVPGLGSKLDFGVDLSAAGLLPVRVTIKNATRRVYRYDTSEIVLVRKDGARVPPLALADAIQQVATAASPAASSDGSLVPDQRGIARRLQTHALGGDSVAANQTLTGYLFYPLAADYIKGRALIEDVESEETEGFVVEF